MNEDGDRAIKGMRQPKAETNKQLGYESQDVAPFPYDNSCAPFMDFTSKHSVVECRHLVW